jgi:hypothetical protein
VKTVADVATVAKAEHALVKNASATIAARRQKRLVAAVMTANAATVVRLANALAKIVSVVAVAKSST